MKKYFDFLSFIPFMFIILFFIKDEDINTHCINNSIFLLINIIIFTLLYFFVCKLKCNKYISISIACIFYIIIRIFKNITYHT